MEGKKMDKVTKDQLEEIIIETVYEMIKDGDESIIRVMREAEGTYGAIEEDLNEWVEKTTQLLEEKLNIDPTPKNIISEDSYNMIKLSGILEEGVDKNVINNLSSFIMNEHKIQKEIDKINDSLATRLNEDTYSEDVAIKLWLPLVESTFPKVSTTMKIAVAKELVDLYYDDVKNI